MRLFSFFKINSLLNFLSKESLLLGWAGRIRFAERRPRFLMFFYKKMAGLAGFEPTHDGTKTRCLTTWRQPNISIF